MRTPQSTAARRKGFTLIELLVVVAIIALLISILLPSLARARELAKRTACGANMNAIGKSCLTYAEANKGPLPCAMYQKLTGGVLTDPTNTEDAGMSNRIGGRREFPDGTIAGPPPGAGDTGSTPRSYFKLLVGGRRAYMQPKQFICPSASATLRHRVKGGDATWDFGGGEKPLYDFSGNRALSKGELSDFSYSFQVTGKNTNAGVLQGITLTNTQDPRKALAADRNPYSNTLSSESALDHGAAVDPALPKGSQGFYYYFSTTGIPGFPVPKNTLTGAQYMQYLRTREANSRNHAMDGQNVLRLDGSSKWQVQSKCGADDDCIWTTQQSDGSATGLPIADLAPPTDQKGYGGERSRVNWQTDSILRP